MSPLQYRILVSWDGPPGSLRDYGDVNMPRSNFVKFGLPVIGLVALAFAAWFAYQQGIANSRQAGNPAAATPPAPTATGNMQWETEGVYGGWRVRCPVPRAEGSHCIAALGITQKDTGKTVMSWSMTIGKSGSPVALLETPTGVQLSSGIEIKLGEAPARKIPYLNCLPTRCTAVTPMDAAFVKDMIATKQANIKIAVTNGRSLDFGLPLDGFAEALAAVSK